VRTADGGVGNTIPESATNDYTPALPDTKAVLDIHIGLAEALGLPSVGVNALLDDDGMVGGDLHNSWDWAKSILRNLVENTREKYPGITISEILSKGGVFDLPGEEYRGDHLSYTYGNIIRTFIDPVARTRDSVTGDYYSGVPRYRPLTHSDGSALNDRDYPLRLITYKTVHHGQARTNVNPWLMLIIPENPVEISALDAASLDIETGDRVRVTSQSHRDGIEGKALVTHRLKPGVVAISHHYGHWEQSSRPMVVDGVITDHDPSRGAGLQPTQIMRTDDRYNNVSLQEPLGASCSFFDTNVRIRKL
jgi:anaerobic selenocysteine-containing dehydrogenase